MSPPISAILDPAGLGVRPLIDVVAIAGGNRACLAVARKLLKRSFHTLRELGEEALQPA